MSNLATSSDPRAPAVWLVFGSAFLWVAGVAGTMLLDDPRLRYPSFLTSVGVAAVGWIGLVRFAPRQPATVIRALMVVAIGLRLWALALAPAFSEDVFRYVYEGRLVWILGPGAPFAHPPAAAPSLGLPPGLLDEAWLRINHPELSTIYPPLSQLVFAAAGQLGDLLGGRHLFALKLLLVAADLGAWAAVAKAARKLGRPSTDALVGGLCPLVILEVAREGHADSLSALGLAVGIYGFCAARPRVGYLGWALAALAKLNGLVVLPAAVRSTRRGLGIAVGLCFFLATPWVLAGSEAGVGLSAYAQRWRAGDGAFSVLLWVAELVLGGDWASFGSVTVTRHQLARVFTAGLFGAAMLGLLRTSAPKIAVPARAGTLLLLLLLLAPTLHPWYVTWLLPFAAVAPGYTGRRSVLWLAALAPLLHHPGWLELIEGQWRDVPAVRWSIHALVWAVWIRELFRARQSGYAPRAADAPP